MKEEEMKLEALLAALRESGGEFPDTFLDDATNAYNEDTAVYSGKIEALEEAVAELTSENTRLRAHNYDLLMSGASEPGSDATDDNGEPDSDNDNDGEEVETLDVLFDEH